MSFRTSEGSPQTGPWKKKWKEFTTDLSADSTSQSETLGGTGKGRRWVPRLELQRSDPRERTRVGCTEGLRGHKDTVEGGLDLPKSQGTTVRGHARKQPLSR